jgi:hypothetical protein
MFMSQGQRSLLYNISVFVRLKNKDTITIKNGVWYTLNASAYMQISLDGVYCKVCEISLSLSSFFFFFTINLGVLVK